MSNLAELLYQAYAARIGVVVETDDPVRLRQKLYTIRRDNPDLHCLAILISPTNGRDLWIAKKEVPNGEEG